jgi:hypothetical protein
MSFLNGRMAGTAGEGVGETAEEGGSLLGILGNLPD